jgi:hypothetical protein
MVSRKSLALLVETSEQAFLKRDASHNNKSKSTDSFCSALILRDVLAYRINDIDPCREQDTRCIYAGAYDAVDSDRRKCSAGTGFT